MTDRVPCPGCKEDLSLHCTDRECGWAVCTDCGVVFGPTRAMPLYSKTKKKEA